MTVTFLCVVMNIKDDRISFSTPAHITQSRPAHRRMTIANPISQIAISLCSTGEVGALLQLISSNHVSIRDYWPVRWAEFAVCSENKIRRQFPTRSCMPAKNWAQQQLVASNSKPRWIKGNTVPEGRGHSLDEISWVFPILPKLKSRGHTYSCHLYSFLVVECSRGLWSNFFHIQSNMSEVLTV